MNEFNLLNHKGTYGIVTSIISAVHPLFGTTVSRFTFSTGPSVSVDIFWAAFRAYLEHFPRLADAGTYSYFWVGLTGPDEYTFEMHPFFAANHTISQFEQLVKPWFKQLDELSIPYRPKTSYHDNFHDVLKAGFTSLSPTELG